MRNITGSSFGSAAAMILMLAAQTVTNAAPPEQRRRRDDPPPKSALTIEIELHNEAIDKAKEEKRVAKLARREGSR